MEYRNSVGHGRKREASGFENEAAWNPQWVTSIQWVIGVSGAKLRFGFIEAE
jgi:hypothetical protein